MKILYIYNSSIWHQEQTIDVGWNVKPNHFRYFHCSMPSNYIRKTEKGNYDYDVMASAVKGVIIEENSVRTMSNIQNSTNDFGTICGKIDRFRCWHYDYDRWGNREPASMFGITFDIQTGMIQYSMFIFNNFILVLHWFRCSRYSKKKLWSNTCWNVQRNMMVWESTKWNDSHINSLSKWMWPIRLLGMIEKWRDANGIMDLWSGIRACRCVRHWALPENRALMRKRKKKRQKTSRRITSANSK